MTGRQPIERDLRSRDATTHPWRWMQVLITCGCVWLLVACSSTPAQSTSTSAIEQQVEQMRAHGVEIVNLRAEPIKGKRGERIAENYVFDIPSIRIGDATAGTIRVFKDPQYAESEKRLYALLGAPGPTTKLDYVTVEGTRELILHHTLPNDIARRYIDAFRKTATPSPST